MKGSLGSGAGKALLCSSVRQFHHYSWNLQSALYMRLLNLGKTPSEIWLQMEAFESENALLDAFVEAVRALDPDILVGFEVQQGSLGFLVDRASTLERPDPLLRQLSRTPQVIVHAIFVALSKQHVAFRWHTGLEGSGTRVVPIRPCFEHVEMDPRPSGLDMSDGGSHKTGQRWRLP